MFDKLIAAFRSSKKPGLAANTKPSSSDEIVTLKRNLDAIAGAGYSDSLLKEGAEAKAAMQFAKLSANGLNKPEILKANLFGDKQKPLSRFEQAEILNFALKAKREEKSSNPGATPAPQPKVEMTAQMTPSTSPKTISPADYQKLSTAEKSAVLKQELAANAQSIKATGEQIAAAKTGFSAGPASPAASQSQPEVDLVGIGNAMFPEDMQRFRDRSGNDPAKAADYTLRLLTIQALVSLVPGIDADAMERVYGSPIGPLSNGPKYGAMRNALIAHLKANGINPTSIA